MMGTSTIGRGRVSFGWFFNLKKRGFRGGKMSHFLNKINQKKSHSHRQPLSPLASPAARTPSPTTEKCASLPFSPLILGNSPEKTRIVLMMVLTHRTNLHLHTFSTPSSILKVPRSWLRSREVPRSAGNTRVGSNAFRRRRRGRRRLNRENMSRELSSKGISARTSTPSS